VTPDAIIGDMDSIRSDIDESVTTVSIAEQNSTDLEKALRSIDAPLLLGIGFLGGRLDHTLAAMHALVAAADRKVILIGAEDVVFAAPLAWRVAPIHSNFILSPAQSRGAALIGAALAD